MAGTSDSEIEVVKTYPVPAETGLPISPTATRRAIEVAPTRNGDDSAHRLASTEDDDPLSLFPRESGTMVVRRAEGESVALEDLREHVPETEIVLEQLVSRAGALKMHLDRLEDFAAKLTREYRRVGHVSREAERQSATAAQTLKQIEKSLVELTQLHDLARTEERLAALDDLAERMTRRARHTSAIVDSFLRTLGALFHKSAAVMRSGGARTKRSLTALPSAATRTFVGWNERRISLRLQVIPRPMLIRRAVIAGLGMLALLVFIVARSLGTTDRIGATLAASRAAPALTASTLNLPLTVLPARAPSFIVPRRETATTATKPPSLEARQPKSPVQPPQFVGALEVQSDPPGGAVFINRQRIGETPLELPRLHAGSQVVWIERDGYLRWTAAVRVSADRLTRVSVKLQREPGP